MKRKLTISFTRAVGSVTQPPSEIEVVLMALKSRASSDTDLTYLPTPDRRVIRVDKPVVVVEFDVTPSEDRSFKEPIHYRIAWRRGYLGKMESHDFLMPNQDISFEDLLRLESIDPNNALSESDLGTPGRVAQLLADGRVAGSDGVPLYTPEQIDGFFSEAEELRQREDQGILEHLDTSLSTFQSTVDTSVRRQISDSERGTNQAIALTREQYQAADQTLRQELLGLIGEGSGEVPENLLELLDSKADLKDGKIKYEQLPLDILRGDVVQIASNDRLTSTQASAGDIAISPTDGWILQGEYTNENDWIRISTLLRGIQSINGKSGESVNLSAEDVGARPSGSIPLSDVTGVGQRFTQELEGVIRVDEDEKLPTSLLRDDVPRLDGERILNSAGEEIPLRGDVTSVNGKTGEVSITAEDIGARKAGESIPMRDITNLTSSLNLKVGVSDPRLTDRRVPTDHADSHKVSGEDPLVLEQSQITNLVSDLGDRATKDEFEAFRDAIYADLPDNPEQQANAASEFAALSLTGASNSTDKLEQMSIYLNETSAKYSLFEENSDEITSKYNEILLVGDNVSGALDEVRQYSSQVSQDKETVYGIKQDVESSSQVVSESTALSLLVAELFNFGTDLDNGGLGERLEYLRGSPGEDGEDGTDGEDGHSPVIEWDGTSLVIDGETGPDLKGEPGEPGSDGNDGEDGRDGQDGVGGITPEQLDERIPGSLSLSLVDDVGTRIFAGSTMLFGDTGLLDISHLLVRVTSSQTWEGLTIRREGDKVTVEGEFTIAGNISRESPFTADLPEGFRPASQWKDFLGTGIVMSGDSNRMVAIGNPYNVNQLFPSETLAEGEVLGFQIIYFTNDLWPSEAPAS